MGRAICRASTLHARPLVLGSTAGTAGACCFLPSPNQPSTCQAGLHSVAVVELWCKASAVVMPGTLRAPAAAPGNGVVSVASATCAGSLEQGPAREVTHSTGDWHTVDAPGVAQAACMEGRTPRTGVAALAEAVAKHVAAPDAGFLVAGAQQRLHRSAHQLCGAGGGGLVGGAKSVRPPDL